MVTRTLAHHLAHGHCMNQKNDNLSSTAGPTWTSSHVYGECMVNHARQLMFIKIPKCASTWADSYIAKLGNNPSNTWLGANFQDTQYQTYTPLIILRDPIERWISCLPMAHKISSLVKNELEINQLLSQLHKFIVDEHLAPQSDFISGINLANAKFFWCDNNLDRRFEQFMLDEGFSNVGYPEHQNVGLQDNQSIQARASWKQLFSRPDYINCMHKLYHQDYKLINFVNDK